MRSLWSGVSGLQAHQVAMDVEGNNISNVNTTGFKYSRADFGTMFSQTVKIATAPTDGRGMLMEILLIMQVLLSKGGISTGILKV